MFRNFRTISCVFSLIIVFTLLGAMFTPMTSVQAREGGSLPVAPTGMISDKTPTYKWYNIVTATDYEYELYKGAALIYSKKVAGTCGTTYCTHTPTTTLTLANYKWRIRYYIGAAPQTWSAWKYFQVVPAPKDFNSNFNGSMSGWTIKPGATWNVDSTTLYTVGEDDEYSSIYSSVSPVFGNFDYVVKAKSNTKYTNCLAVRMGDDFSAGPNVNLGYPGYLFCFQTHGYFSVVWLDAVGSVSYVQSWTPTTAIDTYDWNRYRVVAVGPYFQYYINGEMVYSFKDSSRSKGYVGIVMSKSGADPTLFEVDYANLNVMFATSPLPDAQISPEQQALNEAASEANQSSEFLLP
jgi:hypothetical protein